MITENHLSWSFAFNRQKYDGADDDDDGDDDDEDADDDGDDDDDADDRIRPLVLFPQCWSRARWRRLGCRS